MYFPNIFEYLLALSITNFYNRNTSQNSINPKSAIYYNWKNLGKLNLIKMTYFEGRCKNYNNAFMSYISRIQYV